MREELYLTCTLFVRAEEEQRCRQHLGAQAVMTVHGVTPSGQRRHVTGMVISIMPGSVLHPGYPVMLAMRERVQG
jgi:hypothetical protein